MTPAESLAERTGKAIAWTVAQHAATDLATLTDDMSIPDEPQRKALFLEDLTEVYFRSLSYAAANTYALCLLQADPEEAGKVYRSDDVQMELRTMAMRIARGVMEKP